MEPCYLTEEDGSIVHTVKVKWTNLKFLYSIFLSKVYAGGQELVCAGGVTSALIGFAWTGTHQLSPFKFYVGLRPGIRRNFLAPLHF